MTRKEANLELLRKLKHYFEMNPEIRFGQALLNLEVIKGDDSKIFYEEPTDALNRMNEQRKKNIKETL